MLKTMLISAAVAGVALVFVPVGRAGTVTDDFNTPRDYAVMLEGTIWDGLKVTGPAGSIAACETTNNPGLLNFGSSNTQGHIDHAILYKLLPADTDFEATVRMVGGNWVPNGNFVTWHSAGLTAAMDVDDWVANFYFSHPEWTATFVGRSVINGVENNLNTDAGGLNVDTYPYVKLARVGNVFLRYYSADGTNWTFYSQHSRPDMAGVPLEIGLRHAMYSGNTAYALFDEFTLTAPGIGENPGVLIIIK